MRSRGLGRAAFAAVGALLVVAPIALSAQSDDRRRAIGDWLVEEGYDGNGSRVLRMTRETGDYRLDYHMTLGEQGETSQGFLVWRLNCGQGAEESLAAGAAVESAAARRRLADYLSRCETPAAEASDLLRDFDRGFAVLSGWRQDAEVDWSAAGNAADAAADAMENAADAMDMSADSMDFNMSPAETHMNSVFDENSTIHENAADVPEDPPK